MPIVHFYTIGGSMLGGDLHMYYTVVPPSPMGLPVPYQWHVVAEKFTSLTSKVWRWTASVRNMGLPMLQGQWSLYIVPHVFIPVPPPHPVAEGVQFAVVIATSSSAPVMTSSSVTAVGESASMCTISMVGTQLNCNAPVPWILNVAISPNSVVTNATLGDYIAGALGAALNAALAYGLGKLGAKYAGKFFSDKIAAAVSRQAAIAVAQNAGPLIVAAAQAVLDALNKAGVPVADPAYWGFGKATAPAQKAADS